MYAQDTDLFPRQYLSGEPFAITGNLKTDEIFLNGLESVTEDDIDIDGLGYKVLVWLQTTYYHTFLETLSVILMEHEKDPSMKFIILTTPNNRKFFSNHVMFIFKLFKILNIDYQVYDVLSNRKIIIRNFGYYENIPLHQRGILLINKEIKRFVIDKDTLPTKNVYVSRKKVPIRPDHFTFGPSKEQNDKLIFKDDYRVDDESLIEQFFIDLGFEIVYPEDFLTFEDQINYFNSVKTIASLTSAGLANALFMQKGGNMIELSTPLVVNGQSQLHMHYAAIALSLDMNYTSIPHMRNFSEIEKRIKHIESAKEM